MKPFRLTVAALATAALAVTASNVPSVFAQSVSQPIIKEAATLSAQNKQTIGAAELDESNFILSTNPTSNFGGNQRYGLMIIEQKTDARPCYSTTGSNPTQVDPLLRAFDFSGICGRSTDTNGYAIRVAGNQVRYNPVLEEENGVLVLYAEPSPFLRDAERFVIGQTDGIATTGYTQISLTPGWRLTRKTVDGVEGGLVYLTNDSTVAQLSGQEVPIEPGTGTPGPIDPPVDPATPVANSFPDVVGDIYANAINRAVQLGFISGFAEDNTFRPQATLTREQVVSMAMEALNEAPEGAATANPYPDVPSTRWSAAKIARARALNIVSGYPDGSFRPTDPVTRAELIAIVKKAAEYSNNGAALAANQTGQTFTDTSGHWAQDVISQMSSYCGVATPLNEVTGSGFFPDQAAQRNYAAAAMVRLLDCSQTAAQ